MAVLCLKSGMEDKDTRWIEDGGRLFDLNPGDLSCMSGNLLHNDYWYGFGLGNVVDP
jgi:hypothetical protein